MKIVAVLLTEGVKRGERGLDICGLITQLGASLPQLIDFLHATVLLDLNPHESGPVYPVEIELRNPHNEVIATCKTRTSLALSVQGAPTVVTFPLGSVFLDMHGPYYVHVRVGNAAGSVAFDFHG